MKCVSYLELVYFVTAFVPSETACSASSPGRSQAAVSISCFSGQDSCLQQESSQIVIDKSSWCSWLGRKHLYQGSLASITSRCRWRRTPSSWTSSKCLLLSWLSRQLFRNSWAACCSVRWVSWSDCHSADTLDIYTCVVRQPMTPYRSFPRPEPQLETSFSS